MNKAHGITKENLLASLPTVLANDDNMAALASAVAEVLAARVGEIERVSIYSQIDRLPNELLDILANDFKVDWWDANYTLEEKRRTLKDSWNVHRRLGTKAAVVLAISAIYPDTQVSEWWEYGGAGLGLALVWEIAALHGGTVEVEASSENGTVMLVTLSKGATT